mgnify:CR=1 FL=1
MSFSKKRDSLLCIVIALMTLSGCSSKNASNARGDSYERLFKSLTEEERVYSELEPVMTAHVTHWTQPLAQAYVEEYSRQFRMTPEEEAVLAKEQLAEVETYVIFIVSMATREPDWSDLGKSTSMWRLTLESPDGTLQATPVRVHAISQKDEVSKYFFKEMGSFTKTYKVLFPREKFQNLERARMFITGPRGNVKYDFALRGKVD